MNKILSCLLLFITLNIQAAQQTPETYDDFVNKMTTMEPKALLTWFLEVGYTKDSLNSVLNNLNSQNLAAKEKESFQINVNQLMDEKNIDQILQQYINSKKNIDRISQQYINSKKAASTSKTAKEDSEYAKELISDILNNIPKYLQSSIYVLYQNIDDDKALKIIEFFKLEVEDEDKKNNFLTAQKNILFNKLKTTSFNANFEDGFKNKTLLELQKECENNKINIDIKKAALVVFHLNSIANRVAQSNSLEFSSAISHAKSIIERIFEMPSYFNTKYPYQSLAVTFPDECNPLEGKREPGKIIPAQYKYIVSMSSDKELEKFFFGKLKCFLLSATANTQLEQAIRDNKFNIDEIKIDEYKCLKDIKVQLNNKELLITALYKEGELESPVKIYRYLYLFGNKFETSSTWNPLQTNLFMSNFLNPLDSSIYPTTDKKFKPNIELFINNAGYMKVLQHVLNYNNLKCKFSKTTKGYFGTKSIVPRNIVLGDSTNFWELQKNGDFFVINNNFFNQQDKAYVCKNNIEQQNDVAVRVERSLLSYNEELSLKELQQLAQSNNDNTLLDLCFTDVKIGEDNKKKFDKNKVLTNLNKIFIYLKTKDLKYDMLSIQEKEGSKGYYVIDHGINLPRKQMCIAVMGYTEELSLTVLAQLAETDSTLLDLCFTDVKIGEDNKKKFDKNKVLTNLNKIFFHFKQKGLKYDMLSIQEEDDSTSYYCVMPEQLYLENLIEYRPSLLEQML